MSNQKNKYTFAWILFLSITLCHSALGETWECEIVYDYTEFIENDVSDAETHTFVRASSKKYIHTYKFQAYENGDLRTFQDTQDLSVVDESSLRLFAIHADVTGSTSVSLNQVSKQGPWVQLTRHGSLFPTRGAGLCRVTCSYEDKQRFIAADKVCS